VNHHVDSVDQLPHMLAALQMFGHQLLMPVPDVDRTSFFLMLGANPIASNGSLMTAGGIGRRLKELKARGLIRRTLIVTPANLTFQWQRELADKFREKFDIIRGDMLRANYGQNPWQERDQVITSVSWVALVEDARESLLRSRWDLVIVDEAHKMSAPGEDRKTYAYRLGEALSGMTDHYLLMTATPHKGDQDHFRRFLALLDPDVYGSIKSLQHAMREHEEGKTDSTISENPAVPQVSDGRRERGPIGRSGAQVLLFVRGLANARRRGAPNNAAGVDRVKP